MRILLLLGLSLIVGCSAKSTGEAGDEVITRVGVIADKQDVSMDEVETGTRGRTSVYGSISSGGRVSIGIGVLFSSILSGGSDPNPVRYEIDLLDGGQMTIYHDSRDFEVDDCVKITVHPDEKKHPPKMQRNKDGCESTE